MSNSRIFCTGFVIWFLVVTVLSWFGAQPRFTGFERTIGNFLIGSAWGISAVALRGDRKRATPITTGDVSK